MIHPRAASPTLSGATHEPAAPISRPRAIEGGLIGSGRSDVQMGSVHPRDAPATCAHPRAIQPGLILASAGPAALGSILPSATATGAPGTAAAGSGALTDRARPSSHGE